MPIFMSIKIYRSTRWELSLTEGNPIINSGSKGNECSRESSDSAISNEIRRAMVHA